MLLIASWLLRACAPVDPETSVATLETDAPPAPPPPPDPTPLLKASLDDAQSDEKKLKDQLAALEADLKDKAEQCKPVEVPKPPPPPPPVAKVEPPKPAPPQQASAAPPVNRPPPGMLPLRLVGRFRWRGGHAPQALSRRKAGLRRHQLQSLCAGRTTSRWSIAARCWRHGRAAQRPRRLRLRLESGRRGLFGRCHRNRRDVGHTLDLRHVLSARRAVVGK